MKRSYQWIAGSALVCGAIGAGTVAIATGDTPSRSAGPPELSVLAPSSNAPAAEEALPSVLERGGFDLDGARIALRTADGLQVIAATRTAPEGLGARGQLICALIVPSDFSTSKRAGTAGCATPEEFNRLGLLSAGVGADGGYRVTGLVPEGVETVTVGFADGTEATADVGGNAVAIEGSRAPVRATFDGPDGHTTVDLSLPVG